MKKVNLKIVWKQIHRAEERALDAMRWDSKVKREIHVMSDGTRYVHAVGENPIVLTLEEAKAIEAAGYHRLMEELLKNGKSMRMSKLTNKRVRRKINKLVKIGEEKLASQTAPKVEEYKPAQSANHEVAAEPVEVMEAGAEDQIQASNDNEITL